MTALGLGTHLVEAPCPDCGAVLDLVLRLSTTRTTSTDDDPRVRLKARSTAVTHVCRRNGGHRPLTIEEAVEEALADDAPTGLPIIVDADLVRNGDAGLLPPVDAATCDHCGAPAVGGMAHGTTVLASWCEAHVGVVDGGAWDPSRDPREEAAP